ncbi:MAG: hypothetical protein AABX96_03850 [Nanoarchaeota archaeon]
MVKKDNLVGLLLGGALIGSLIFSPKGPTPAIKIRSYKSPAPVVIKEDPRKYCNLTKPVRLIKFADYESPFINHIVSSACPPQIFDSAINAELNGEEWRVTNTQFIYTGLNHSVKYSSSK